MCQAWMACWNMRNFSETRENAMNATSMESKSGEFMPTIRIVCSCAPVHMGNIPFFKFIVI